MFIKHLFSMREVNHISNFITTSYVLKIELHFNLHFSNLYNNKSKFNQSLLY